MASEKKLTKQVKALLWEKGQRAVEMARQTVRQEKIPSEQLKEALEYFMSLWEDVAHPALLALCCEAVGGKPESTTQVGAALVLFAGGADVHDDIVDQSTFKYGKPTVVGKYGGDMALLVGDALLFEGFYALQAACAPLPASQRQAIFELVKEAFFGISSAEAKEASLHGKTGSSVAEEYLEMIKTKAAVGEATAKIGAILGGGTAEEVEALGHYGKTVAVLLTVRDEFIDAFELDELKNRAEKECLPLPILYALKNPEKAGEIMRLIGKKDIAEEELERLLDLVIDSEETRELKKEMQAMIREEGKQLQSVKLQGKALKLTLRAMQEDL